MDEREANFFAKNLVGGRRRVKRGLDNKDLRSVLEGEVGSEAEAWYGGIGE